MCTFDFPGHGSSPAFREVRHDLDTYADITNLVIDRLSPRRVFLIGHSMGGAVGTIVASGRRDVECVISVEGNLVAQDCGIVSRSIARQSLSEFSSIGFQRFLAELKESARSDFSAWASWYRRASAIALHESAHSLVEWSDSGRLLELFNSLTNKIYIYGDENENGKYVLPQLSDARTHHIARAGHFLMLDQPNTFYHTLVSYIGEGSHIGADRSSLTTSLRHRRKQP
jgi:pimeloyl-ACP methyl ester carboxylesterase